MTARCTWLFNTIVTPFISPVVELSAPKASAELVGNLIWDGGQRQNGQKLIAVRAGAVLENASGKQNRLGGMFAGLEGTALDGATNVIRRFDASPFAAPTQHDYRLLAAGARQLGTPLDAKQIPLPATPGATATDGDLPLAWQYRHPADKQRRETAATLTLGACGQAN